MLLSRKQKDDLKLLDKLDSQKRANANYKIRSKLEDALDGLADIEFMLSHLPRDHAQKAVKDKHVAKVMNILLALLDLREFKRVRQNSPGEQGYVIKKSRGRFQRVPLTQKDYNRYRAMYGFSLEFKNYFNPRVALPGDSDFMDIGPRPRALEDWLVIDDHIDYHIHQQQLYGDPLKAMDLLTMKEAIQQNIEATNEMIRFFKSTH